MSECVKVIVRCRPMNGKEKDLNCAKVVTVTPSLFQIGLTKARILGSELAEGKTTSDKTASDPTEYEPKAFTFDGVYDDDSTQQEVYEDTAYPLVLSVIEGYNGTIFAYGQTGCGKTFTMEGVRNGPIHLRGIIPSTFYQVFDTITNNSDPSRTYLVRASYMEIYNEEVRDLLADDPKQGCEVKEDKDKGVYIKGLTNNEVKSVNGLENLMATGNTNRTVGATLMNAGSSRSHSIFTMTIECSEPDTAKPGEFKIKQGKLNLVDLAGSERQSKTQAVGVRLKEATKINLSLSALGNVIEALVKVGNGNTKIHIPYRDSKLTRLLSDSLGGNTKTVMIAAISPADYNYDETLSTLRYANRAKNIKNKPKINQDPKDALLKEYQDEIKRLKLLLEEKGLLGEMTNSTKLSAPTQPTTKNNATPTPKPPSKSTKPAEEIKEQKEEEESDNTPVIMRNSVIISPTPVKPPVVPIINTIPENNDNTADIEYINELQEEIHQQERIYSILEEEIEKGSNDTIEIKNKINALSIELNIENSKESEKKDYDLVIDLENEIQDLNIEYEKLTVELQDRIEEKENINKKISEWKKEINNSNNSINNNTNTNNINNTAESKDNEHEELQLKLSQLEDKLHHRSSVVTSGEEEKENINNVNQLSTEEINRIKKKKEKELNIKKLELQRLNNEQEEANLFLEEKYSDLQAELQDKSKKLKKLIHKYKQLENDKQSIENEWEHEKEAYLNDLRTSGRELQLYLQVLQTVLTRTDINKIVKNAVWSTEREEWKLPKMDIPICLPKIMVKSEKRNRRESRRQSIDTENIFEKNYNNISNNSTFTNTRIPSAREGKDIIPSRSQSRAGNNSTPVQPSPDGADNGWKRNIIASIKEETGILTSNTNIYNITNSVPTTPTNHTVRPVSREPANTITPIEMSDAIIDITSTVKARPVFQPASSNLLTPAPPAQEYTGTLSPRTREIKKRPVFEPAVHTLNSNIEFPTSNGSLSPRVPIRPNFSPAIGTDLGGGIVPGSDGGFALPESVFNVPIRPAFTPGK